MNNAIVIAPYADDEVSFEVTEYNGKYHLRLVAWTEAGTKYESPLTILVTPEQAHKLAETLHLGVVTEGMNL